MAGEDMHLETLARTTDLLLEITEPGEMARRFLEHVLRAFNASAGILHFAHASAPLLLNRRMDGVDGGALAARLLAELRTRKQLFRSWNGRELDPVLRAWSRVVAVRPGRPEPETVLVLGFAEADHEPALAGSRLLQLMVRNAAIALENALLHAHTRRQAERLAVQAEELERIHQALEHHSREIERNLAARSRFFAVMSHELRTPINAILGYNQLLQQGAYEPLLPAQRDVTARIDASAEQLLALVNDVLDFSKMDAGKVDVRWSEVEIADVVADAAAAVEANARLKGLAFRVDCAPALPGLNTDPARVRQILLNLLANAIKFTPSGTVVLTIRHETNDAVLSGAGHPSSPPGEQGWITLRVQDTGVGIPPDQIEAIFGEFVQFQEPQSGRTQGTGLGLAIASRLARILGGDLTVHSQVGVATTFTLFLPCPGPRIETRKMQG